MHHIGIRLATLNLAGLFLVGMSLLGQTSKVVRIEIENHGSVPPVRAWYACVRKLDGQPTFDTAKGNDCLREILSHREYFKSGRIRISHSKFDLEQVIFILRSPTLKLTSFDYGITEELQSEFQDYVAGNNLLPRVGDDYDFRDELNNASRIENFFESKGIMVGVSRRTSLDYRAGTASFKYKIWVGPDGPIRPLLTDCGVRITSFSLLDLDDFTPLNLVLKSTHTRDGECFSETAIREDEQTLKSMQIFSEVSYTEGDGNGSGRGVSLHARTNPLMVSAISIGGLGLSTTANIISESSKLSFPQLLLKPSQNYRQSDAEASRRLLETYFRRDGTRVRVYEDDDVRPDRTLWVTYNVLTWPADELYIDGQRFE
jgi:hypothetical protein